MGVNITAFTLLTFIHFNIIDQSFHTELHAFYGIGKGKK